VQQAALEGAWSRAVVCDYRLGNAYNGVDSIAELRVEFGDDLPAILVTGDLDPQIQTRAAEQNIRVMHKPIDRDQLLRALHTSTRPDQA
jgi:CheY-like chemotaxis protein